VISVDIIARNTGLQLSNARYQFRADTVMLVMSHNMIEPCQVTSDANCTDALDDSNVHLFSFLIKLFRLTLQLLTLHAFFRTLVARMHMIGLISINVDTGRPASAQSSSPASVDKRPRATQQQPRRDPARAG
jgi:hypothetical protein